MLSIRECSGIESDCRDSLSCDEAHVSARCSFLLYLNFSCLSVPLRSGDVSWKVDVSCREQS